MPAKGRQPPLHVKHGTIRELIEAAQLDHPCNWGCDWEPVGGRECSVHGPGCSEDVQRCRRCGAYDYRYSDCGGEFFA